MFSKIFRKLETTKRLLRFCMIIATCVAVGDVVYSFRNGHSDVMTCLTDNVFKLAFICVGFYVWKAKCENIKKYGKENTPDD